MCQVNRFFFFAEKTPGRTVLLPDGIWQCRRHPHRDAALGVTKHPAIEAVRELRIRPKRKFCRSSARNGFFTPGASFQFPTIPVG